MPKQQKIIFFIDFDDTLFNTQKFKKGILQIFLNNGITRKQFNNFYYSLDKFVKPKYNPYVQIKILEKKLGIKGNKIKKELDIFLQESKKYLFSDTIDFLKKIKKKTNQLILISYGDNYFQKIKVKYSGLKKFFNKIIITDKTKIEVILNYKKINDFNEIFFIEDHPKQLDKARKKINILANDFFKKIKIIKISRREGRYSQIKTDFNFEKFNTLWEIFKKYDKI